MLSSTPFFAYSFALDLSINLIQNKHPHVTVMLLFLEKLSLLTSMNGLKWNESGPGKIQKHHYVQYQFSMIVWIRASYVVQFTFSKNFGVFRVAAQ